VLLRPQRVAIAGQPHLPAEDSFLRGA